jgi:hypothetical protein
MHTSKRDRLVAVGSVRAESFNNQMIIERLKRTRVAVQNQSLAAALAMGLFERLRPAA